MFQGIILNAKYGMKLLGIILETIYRYKIFKNNF